MKLRELIVEFEKLAASNPDVRIESVKYIGNGTSSTEAAFVDAKLHGDLAVVRFAVPPFDVANIKEYTVDA